MAHEHRETELDKGLARNLKLKAEKDNVTPQLHLRELPDHLIYGEP